MFSISPSNSSEFFSGMQRKTDTGCSQVALILSFGKCGESVVMDSCRQWTIPLIVSGKFPHNAVLI